MNKVQSNAIGFGACIIGSVALSKVLLWENPLVTIMGVVVFLLSIICALMYVKP